MEQPVRVDDLLLTLQEYESLIDSLTSQLQFYANEQENLRKEITVLVRENQLLSRTVRELMENKIWSGDDKETQTESELVANLKNQLALITKEKDTVVELWQTGLKNIDRLEQDLKLYEEHSNGYFSKNQVLKIKEKYESIVNSFEHQIIDSHSKIEQLTQIILDNKSDLNKANELHTSASSQIHIMEINVAKLQSKLEEIINIRDNLQVELDKKSFVIEDLQIREMTAKAKVTEAIQLIEAACMEKNCAIYNETKAKEEVLELSKTLSELIKETPEKINAEANLVRQECTAKVENMQKLLEERSNEVAKLATECNSLANQVGNLKRGNYSFDDMHINKLLVLEKNLESTFQKLLLAEKRNILLETEKEALKADIEQMGDCYKRDIKSREVEKGVLSHEIKSLRKKLLSNTSHAADVTNQVEKFKLDMKEKIEHEQSQRQKVEEMRTQYEDVQHELYNHLELQIQLHKKWKKEISGIFKKLIERINNLKISNRSLRKKLKRTIIGLLQYKDRLNEMFVKVDDATPINEDHNVVN